MFLYNVVVSHVFGVAGVVDISWFIDIDVNKPSVLLTLMSINCLIY